MPTTVVPDPGDGSTGLTRLNEDGKVLLRHSNGRRQIGNASDPCCCCVLCRPCDDEVDVETNGVLFPKYLRLRIRGTIARTGCFQDVDGHVGTPDPTSPLNWTNRIGGDFNRFYYLCRSHELSPSNTTQLLAGEFGWAYTCTCCPPPDVWSYGRYSDACVTETTDPLEFRFSIWIWTNSSASTTAVFANSMVAATRDPPFITSGAALGYPVGRLFLVSLGPFSVVGVAPADLNTDVAGSSSSLYNQIGAGTIRFTFTSSTAL